MEVEDMELEVEEMEVQVELVDSDNFDETADKLTTEDSESENVSNKLDEDIPNEKEDRWQYLPSLALQKVYSYLGCKDKTSMSLVCKRWSPEFEAPCNWKTLKFNFPDRPQLNLEFASVKFAKRYGHMVQHVEMVFRRVPSSLFTNYALQFEEFVQCLCEKASLHSITFSNLKPFLRWLEDFERERIVNGLIHLLRVQNTIQSLEFQTSDFKRDEVSELFNAVFLSSKSPVSKLICKKMLCERQFDADSEDEDTIPNLPRVRWLFSALERVKTWITDYDEIFENALVSFPNLLVEDKDTKNVSLKQIIMKWKGWSIADVAGIPQDNWRAFRRHCPDLKVDFTISVMHDPGATVRLLLPKHMPLRALDFRLQTRSLHDAFSTNDLLDHIVQNNLHLNLEELNLTWLATSVDLAHELDTFVRQCPVLRTMVILAQYPLLYLEDLFLSWMTECPKNIKTVFITICSIPNDDVYIQLESLADSYVPILQSLEINFELILETTRIYLP